MKRSLLVLSMLVVFVAFSHAQKKVGTVYAEHEYIDKTRALWDAFQNGDTEKYQSFFADSVFVTSNGNTKIGKAQVTRFAPCPGAGGATGSGERRRRLPESENRLSGS